MPHPNALPMNRNDFTERDLRRFWAKVDKSDPEGCWPWTAELSNGYGRFRWKETSRSAHRFSYVIAHGDCPIDLVVDHLCRNRSCINPTHLEAVPHEENIRRGARANSKVTQCPQGHPYDAANTYFETNGKTRVTRRICRECKLARLRKRNEDPTHKEQQKAYREATREQKRLRQEAYKERRTALYREKLVTMTSEEREAINARARENYQKRKERAAR